MCVASEVYFLSEDFNNSLIRGSIDLGSSIKPAAIKALSKICSATIFAMSSLPASIASNKETFKACFGLISKTWGGRFAPALPPLDCS